MLQRAGFSAPSVRRVLSSGAFTQTRLSLGYTVFVSHTVYKYSSEEEAIVSSYHTNGGDTVYHLVLRAVVALETPTVRMLQIEFRRAHDAPRDPDQASISMAFEEIADGTSYLRANIGCSLLKLRVLHERALNRALGPVLNPGSDGGRRTFLAGLLHNILATRGGRCP